MALIKCSECGADISSEAIACPHCGKPNNAPKNDVLKPRPRSNRAALFVLIVSFLGVIAWLILQSSPALQLQARYDLFLFEATHDISFVFQHSHDVAPLISQPQVNPGSEVPLQEVKNLGYDFYIGQIEEPGVSDINDDVKNQITKVAYDTHFPVRLLKNTPIIILNNLALTGDQYVSVQNTRLHVPDLKGDFLSEGGLYARYDNGAAVIYINKSTVTAGSFIPTLTHEFGHAIGDTLTDSQWKAFYQLRDIPPNTPRQGTDWNLSPTEDFAEVYKNVFTGGSVQTFYGLLEPAYGSDATCDKVYQDALDSYEDPSDPTTWYAFSGTSFFSGTDYASADAKATANPKVQACRREALSNPAKWQFGMPPYKATVGPKTKLFIETLAASSSSL